MWPNKNAHKHLLYTHIQRSKDIALFQFWDEVADLVLRCVLAHVTYVVRAFALL